MMYLRRFESMFLVCVVVSSSELAAFDLIPPVDSSFSPTRTYRAAGNWKSVFLNPITAESIIRGGTDDLLNQLNSDFPEWTFNLAPDDLRGSFEIQTYQACAPFETCGPERANLDGGVGAFFDMKYVPGSGDPIIAAANSAANERNLHWVQLVKGNHGASGHGDTRSFVDAPNGATSPYYDQNGIYDDNGFAGGVTPDGDFVFRDIPYRTDDALNHQWSSELYLVEETGPKTATIHNGVRWGWGNDGSSIRVFDTNRPTVARFMNSEPASESTTGEGTNALTWGKPAPSPGGAVSSLLVEPQTIPVAPKPRLGEPFLAANITYTNGTIQGGTGINGVELTMDYSLSVGGVPFPIDVVTSQMLEMINTPNTDDPRESADIVRIDPVSREFGLANNFHVFEGETAMASLMGRLTEASVGLDGWRDSAGFFVPGEGLNETGYIFEVLGFAGVPMGGGFASSDLFLGYDPIKSEEVSTSRPNCDIVCNGFILENTITPRDRFGGELGPGRSDVFVHGVRDNGDGTYTRSASWSGIGVQPNIEFEFADEFITEPNGDFNMDGLLNIEDLNLYWVGPIPPKCETRHPPMWCYQVEPMLDVNLDGDWDIDDVSDWVVDKFGSWIGDANLDGEFNSGDLVQVLNVGLYNTDEPATWGDGDWNFDGRFDPSDLVAALSDGGYELGPREVGVAAVPEPSSAILLVIGLVISARFRRVSSTS